jgi:cytochrome c peroxidase
MTYEIAIFFIIMIFEIFNTILLLCSLAINIKILNITHNIQNKNKIQNPSASLADMAADMMSCDNCNSCNSCDSRDARVSRDSRKENNVSQSVGVDNENVNINLLGNDRQGESREWTEIQISK